MIFNPGDPVQFVNIAHHVISYGIVQDASSKGGWTLLEAVRQGFDGVWSTRCGSIETNLLEPASAEVLASYVAWRLTQ